MPVGQLLMCRARVGWSRSIRYGRGHTRLHQSRNTQITEYDGCLRPRGRLVVGRRVSLRNVTR